MAKHKLRIRAVRLEPELNKRVERATRAAASPIRAPSSAARLNENWRDAKAEDAAEDRLAASLDRLSREIRAVKLGQQALFAFVDWLVKTLLTCVAEPPRDAHDQAVARGKVRYDRFLKSVGAGMAGDSHAAMAELLKRGEEN